MNPDLYACLPPDKKEEYKKLFPEPAIDYAMPTIRIDDCVSSGYAFLGDQVLKLPDAETYTSTWSDENANPRKDLEDLVEEINNSIDEVETLKKYPVFVEDGRPLSPPSIKLRGFARWKGESLIVPVKKDEAFFIDFDHPVDDSGGCAFLGDRIIKPQGVGVGAIAFMPSEYIPGSLTCETYMDNYLPHIECRTSEPEIGLSYGEQRLIKKGIIK